MSKPKKAVIEVQGTAISVLNQNNQDFICLTDMAKKFGDDILIYSWMRNRNTLEFIGIWEQIHNPNFKGLEFETFRIQAGLNSFSLTPRKWIGATNAIGFQSRAGRYGGGTYARIPTGFRPKAQGCEERATLGHHRAGFPNRNAVAALPFSSAARWICHNPVGVENNLIPFTQGSSCVTTLGWRPQSRWDCRNRTVSPFVIRHSSFSLP
jgi:hypothetical protein